MYISLYQPNRDCTLTLWICGDTPLRKREKYEDKTKLG